MTSQHPTVILPPPVDPAEAACLEAHRRVIVERLEGLAGHLPADPVAAHAIERAYDEIDYYVGRVALHLGLVRAGGA